MDVFVKELDSSVSVKSLPVPDAVGMTSLSALRLWLLCGTAKYGLITDSVRVTRERLEAGQTCSHTNTVEKGRGSGSGESYSWLDTVTKRFVFVLNH